MKHILFIILFFIFSIQTFAQDFITEDEATEEENTKPTFWDRTYWGGDFGLMFGNYTSIVISPEMGYLVTPNFSIGSGVIFEYYNSRSYQYNYETTIYGGKIFSRFFIWKDLYVLGILEVVSLETEYYDFAHRYSPTQNRFWFASPLIGAGYMQRFSKKGGIGVSLLFNLNQDMNSPYYGRAMPIIRIGFAI